MCFQKFTFICWLIKTYTNTVTTNQANTLTLKKVPAFSEYREYQWPSPIASTPYDNHKVVTPN